MSRWIIAAPLRSVNAIDPVARRGYNYLAASRVIEPQQTLVPAKGVNQMGTATRRVGVVCAAVLVLSCTGVARCAEAVHLSEEEKAAFAELKSLLQPQPAPKTPEEATRMLAQAQPKIEALAEKNADNQAGPPALYFAAYAASQLDQIDKAKALAETFLKRYPDHGGVPQVRRLLADLNVIGSEAKDFTAQTLDGGDVTLSGFRGKIVLLDFFAGWCGPCRAENPNLVKLYAAYKDRGFEIVGVSLDNTLDEAKKYVQDAGITWVTTWSEPGGWKNPVAVLYGVNAIPAMYLLDKEGKVLRVNIRGEALARAIAKLLPPQDEPK